MEHLPDNRFGKIFLVRVCEEGCSMNIKDNSSFKRVELLDEEININTLIKNYDFTEHASLERAERFREALELNKTDGRQAPFDRIFRVDKGHIGGIELHCVTKNGIIFILNEEKFRNWEYCIVTVLFARVNQAKRLYEDVGIEFPEPIRKKCEEWVARGLNQY